MLAAHGPDFPLIDLLRYVAVIYGAIFSGWVVGHIAMHRDICREGVMTDLALLALWLPVWLTEAEQIGKPWLYWRLPLSLAAIPFTVLAVLAHRRTHHPRRRHAARRVATVWWLRTVLRSAEDRPRSRAGTRR